MRVDPDGREARKELGGVKGDGKNNQKILYKRSIFNERKRT